MPSARLPDINSSFLRHRGEFLDAARHGETQRALDAFYARNALLPSDTDDHGLPLHRVIISAALYRERHRHTVIATCPHCGARHSRRAITILNVRQPPAARAISGRSHVRLWRCVAASLLPDEAAPSLEKQLDKDAAQGGNEADGAEAAEGEKAPGEEGAQSPKPRRGRRRRKAPPPEKPKTCGKTARLDKTKVQDRHNSEPYLCGVIPPPPKRPPGLAGRTPYLQAFQKWAGLANAELEGRSAEYRDVNWKRPGEDDDGDYAAMFGNEALEEK